VAGILLSVAAVFVIAMLAVGFAVALSGSPGSLFEVSGEPFEVVEDTLAGTKSSQDKVVILDVKGIIMSQGGYSVTTGEQVIKELKRAREDSRVVAVVLDMNTPGGEVTACDEIHREIQKLRNDGTPVVTCMGSMGASGGYLIAAGTDWIVASRLTLTGSIGVVIPAYNYAELFRKIGIRSEPFTSGEMKDLLNGGREWTEEERKCIQDLVDETFGEFAQIIADGRAAYETREQVMAAQDFKDGQILSGRKAFELALIDQIGYLEDAVKKAEQLAGVKDARIVRYRRPVRLADLLLMQMNSGGSVPRSVVPVEWLVIKPGRPYFIVPTVLP